MVYKMKEEYGEIKGICCVGFGSVYPFLRIEEKISNIIFPKQLFQQFGIRSRFHDQGSFAVLI